MSVLSFAHDINTFGKKSGDGEVYLGNTLVCKVNHNHTQPHGVSFGRLKVFLTTWTDKRGPFLSKVTKLHYITSVALVTTCQRKKSQELFGLILTWLTISTNLLNIHITVWCERLPNIYISKSIFPIATIDFVWEISLHIDLQITESSWKKVQYFVEKDISTHCTKKLYNWSLVSF